MTLLPWNWNHGTTAAIHDAAVLGNPDKLRRLLANKRVNPNAQVSLGNTALHLAASHGFGGQVLGELLSHPHTNPNVQNVNGKTPLHCAITAHNLAAVESLLADARIDVNLADNAGRTSLHHAVESDPLTDSDSGKVVSLLARASGIDHTAGDKHQRTALAWAYQLGYKNAASALISDRALPLPEVAVVDAEGCTALHWAVKRPWVADVALLAKDQPTAVLNAKDDNGETALHIAARFDDGSSLKALSAAGADLSVRRDTDGATPLHIAVRESSYGLFISRLESLEPSQRKAVLVRDHNGNTPLHLAAERANLTMLKTILGMDKGPHPPMCVEHEANGNGDAPVDLAVRRGHVDVAIYLLRFEQCTSPVTRAKRQGAALALVPHLLRLITIDPITHGTTPAAASAANFLEWAAEHGALAVFRAYWGHPNAPHADQCICIAAAQGHLDVVHYLVEKGVDPNRDHRMLGTPLYAATKHGHTEIMEFLLSLDHVEADRGIVGGYTPLMRAVRDRSVPAASLLLDQKLLENGRVRLDTGNQPLMHNSRTNRTNPLLLACELGYLDMAAMLVRRDYVDRGWIDLNVRDSQRRTPLSLACEAGHSRLVELLLQASSWKPGLVRLDARGKGSRTPFFYACVSADPRTVELFLDGDLLDRGLFDPDAPDKYTTPLGYACQEGLLDVVKIFCRDPRLRHCLNPQELPQDMLTPVILAAQEHEWEVVDLLLQTFSDSGLLHSAMAHKGQGESVLHYALQPHYCAWKTIYTLLANGLVAKEKLAAIQEQLNQERESNAKEGFADPEMEMVAKQLALCHVDDAGASE